MTRSLGRRTVVSGALGLGLGCNTTERAREVLGSPAVSVPHTTVSAVASAGTEPLGARREVRSPSAVSSTSAPADLPGRAAFSMRELEFAVSPVGPEKAIALVPQWGEPGEKFPVLIALHGRGESVRGIDVGANGWLHDYELGKTIARLRSPPLTRGDLQGFVDETRLARLNESLAARPFRGLIVVCPWVPDVLTERDRANLDAAVPFGKFVIDQLLPRVATETPAMGSREATGIDGVSLGGRVSLVVGLGHGDRFGAVGTLQAAIQEGESPALSRRARESAASAPLHLRLVTSDRDYFRNAITQLHLALQADGVAHEYLLIPGPHDYPFNRGPGGVEMLMWHDRVLRGEPPL